MPPTSCCSTTPIFRAISKESPTITTAATREPVPFGSSLHGRADGIWSSIWGEVPAGCRLLATSSVGPCRKGVLLAARKKSDEPRVRVAPLGELRAYTISEQELEKLEQ